MSLRFPPGPPPLLLYLVSATQQGLSNDLGIEFKLSVLLSPFSLPKGLFHIPVGSPPGPPLAQAGHGMLFPSPPATSPPLAFQGDLPGM